MEDRVITMEELNREFKRNERKRKFHEAVNNTTKFIRNNAELVCIGVPMVFGLTKWGAKTIASNKRIKAEKDLKELYCYDRSLGHYWKLKRKLKNSEWSEIDRRKKKGERMSDILNDLRVLD